MIGQMYKHHGLFSISSNLLLRNKNDANKVNRYPLINKGTHQLDPLSILVLGSLRTCERMTLVADGEHITRKLETDLFLRSFSVHRTTSAEVLRCRLYDLIS